MFINLYYEFILKWKSSLSYSNDEQSTIRNLTNIEYIDQESLYSKLE